MAKPEQTLRADGGPEPQAPARGPATAFQYERTIRVPRFVEKPERFHIVIHGLDLNDNGRYDGRVGPLAGAPKEATLPVACGEIRD